MYMYILYSVYSLTEKNRLVSTYSYISCNPQKYINKHNNFLTLSREAGKKN